MKSVIIKLGFISFFMIQPYLYPGDTLEYFGLQDKVVHDLSISTSASYQGRYLFAACDTAGVYYKDLSEDITNWQYLGLRGNPVVSIFAQGAGTGPYDFLMIYAGLHTENEADTTTPRIYKLDFPSDAPNWTAADSGIAAGSITAISGFNYSGHEPPGPLFCTADGELYRYESNQWEKVNDQSGFGFVSAFQPHFVWAGGTATAMTPTLIKSVDYGQTFENITFTMGDNETHCVGMNAVDTNIVYAGFRDEILRTTDGGKNWQSTDWESSETVIRSIAVSPIDPGHALAGGADKTNRFALYNSFVSELSQSV